MLDRMLELAPAEESEIVWARLPHRGAWARWSRLKLLAPRELALTTGAAAAGGGGAGAAARAGGRGALPPVPDRAKFARLIRAVRAAVVRRGAEEEALAADRRARKRVRGFVGRVVCCGGGLCILVGRWLIFVGFFLFWGGLLF